MVSHLMACLSTGHLYFLPETLELGFHPFNRNCLVHLQTSFKCFILEYSGKEKPVQKHFTCKLFNRQKSSD